LAQDVSICFCDVARRKLTMLSFLAICSNKQVVTRATPCNNLRNVIIFEQLVIINQYDQIIFTAQNRCSVET